MVKRKATLGIAAVLVVALLSSGCGGDEPSGLIGVQGPTTAAAAPSTESSPSASAAAAEMRVTDLMKKLGCGNAKVIGTQLYSKETGRCTGSAGDVTVAVFETEQLRDEWVKAGSQFGGNVVVGDGWAVFAEGPDDADAAAEKLGGSKV